MITQSIELASKYLKDRHSEGKSYEPIINHSKRMAERAVLLGYDEIIIASCYLHDVLSLNVEEYHEIALEIKKIDPDLARIADKFYRREDETWLQYYYRISYVPEASKVLWLCLTDKLVDVKAKDLAEILSAITTIGGKVLK